jgi:hypothetical protein
MILVKARNTLRNYPALIKAPTGWLTNLITLVAYCKNTIRRLVVSEAQEIRDKAEALLATARILQATWNNASEKLHRQEYTQAVEKLEIKLAAAGKNSELSEGIRALLNHTRQTWRADRMRLTQNRI